LTEALALDPERVNSLLASTLVHWAAGDDEAARDSVKSAVCYMSDDIDELIMLGMGYARIEDDVQAYEYLARALDLAGMMQRSSPFWQVRSSKRDFRAMPCMPPEKPFQSSRNLRRHHSLWAVPALCLTETQTR